MVVEGGSCEKDLKLVGREVQSRGEELRKERSVNFKFGGDGWHGATEVLEERVLPVGLILMRLRS